MKTLIIVKATLVYVKNMAVDGERKKTEEMTLEVDSDDTVYSVMAQVEEMIGVPPEFQMLTFDDKSVRHDAPGTLAEYELVPTYPDPIYVDYHDPCKLLDYLLRRNALSSLGFCVHDDLFPDASSMLQLARHRDTKMMICVTDTIRKDGARKKMFLVVEPGDTVASLKEQVQRRRGYPVAMQEICVNDPADWPYNEDVRMDELDATLADYNVTKDKAITLSMSIAFALQYDREVREKLFNTAEAEEIAAPAEQQEIAAPAEQQEIAGDQK